MLPVIAKLLGTDLTEHGISIVNVGGKGLRRFSSIFQRSDDNEPRLSIPVACLTDMDVMPDCAAQILGLVSGDEDEKWKSPKRRWKAVRDFGADETTRQQALDEWRNKLRADDDQTVTTFVADHWTLEYDLAFCGLAEDVYVATCLAREEEQMLNGKRQRPDVEADARAAFSHLETASNGDRAVLCAEIYQPLHSGAASKPITAQYLAELLDVRAKSQHFDTPGFASRLPRYIVDAVAHVQRSNPTPILEPGSDNA